MFFANLSYWGASFAVLNKAFTVSLKAKFKACVGKYRITLAMLPVNKNIDIVIKVIKTAMRFAVK